MSDCAICGQTEDWHETNRPRHKFSTGETSQLEPPKPAKISGVIQGDPVVRLALINRGILSYTDLLLAEEELRAARDAGRPLFYKNPVDPDPGPGIPVDPGSIPADL